MIKAVLFDLDGTLLPMDMDTFIRAYFGGITKKAAVRGYEHEKLIKTIWAGTEAMVKNNGTITNEEAFWQVFSSVYGEEALADIPMFDSYYSNEFDAVKEVCGYNAKASETIAWLKNKGVRTILATNPIFPRVATEHRIQWAGLNADDFEYITSYENSSRCKPNPDYYRDILSAAGLRAEECVMVGNDVTEDMAAEALGMPVFLLTDCIINKAERDISVYPHGDFDALRNYLDKII